MQRENTFDVVSFYRRNSPSCRLKRAETSNKSPSKFSEAQTPSLARVAKLFLFPLRRRSVLLARIQQILFYELSEIPIQSR